LRHRLSRATVEDMIQVLIVDDHAMVRAGVKAYIEAEPRLSVVAAVSTVAEAETACDELSPDVVVCDYHLPDGDGLSLCLGFEAAGGPPTVLFSASADDGLAVMAAVAGAHSVVSKAAHPDALIAAVEAAARGRRKRPVATPHALGQAGRRLDPDDLPVLGMVMHGLSPEDIAETMGIDRAELGERRTAMVERLRDEPLVTAFEAVREP
jgi:DNA-binding NarL/FixJ family response regulator